MNENEEVKMLSKKHLRDLEKSSQAMNEIEKDFLIQKLRYDLAQKELALFSANYTLKSREVEELKNSLKEPQERKRNQNAKHLELIKKITEELDLPQKWGFDPLTGEIK